MKPQYLAGIAVVAIAVMLLVVSMTGSDSNGGSQPDGDASPGGCSAAVCASVRIEAVTLAGVPAPSTALPTTKLCAVAAGASAWDCILNAVGAPNLKTTDFGPGLGIFIEGFYGANAVFSNCQCFWEFRTNGAASSVGVEAYKLNPNDTLSFGLSK